MTILEGISGAIDVIMLIFDGDWWSDRSVGFWINLVIGVTMIIGGFVCMAKGIPMIGFGLVIVGVFDLVLGHLIDKSRHT